MSFISSQFSRSLACYFVVYDFNNKIYNTGTQTFEVLNQANISSYPIPAIELVSGTLHTGYYSAKFPTVGTVAGQYNFVLYQQVNPMIPNLNIDQAEDRGFIGWNGYEEVYSFGGTVSMACQDAPAQIDYYVIYNALGQIYNSSTKMFEAFNSANIATYPVSAQEQISSGINTGYYVAAFPTSIVESGKYNFVLYQQANRSVPNLAADTFVDRGFIIWDGFTESYGFGTGPVNSGASAWVVAAEPAS